MNNILYVSMFSSDVTKSFKVVLLRVFQIELQVTQMTATHISLGFRFLKWEFDPTFRTYKDWLITLPKEQ